MRLAKSLVPQCAAPRPAVELHRPGGDRRRRRDIRIGRPVPVRAEATGQGETAFVLSPGVLQNDGTAAGLHRGGVRHRQERQRAHVHRREHEGQRAARPSQR